MNELTSLYKSILESVGCVIDEEDTVNVLSPDEKTLSPQIVTVEGKPLILKLPTTNVLRNGDWSEIAAFHPAVESIFSGQSEIINMLNTRINLKLYKATLEMVVAIGSMASNKSIRKKLTLKQMELISSIPEMTAAGMKYLQQVISKGTGVIGDRPLLNLHLNRGDTIDGVKYSRTCTLITPILDELDPFYDIVSSGKSQLAVRSLYKKVFPLVRSYGSNSKDIPYLESLLLCYYNASNHLNEIRKILGKYKGSTKNIQLDWFIKLSEVKALSKKHIPQSLPGNTGVGGTEEITKDTVVEPKKISEITIPVVSTPTTTSPVSAIRSGKVEPIAMPIPPAPKMVPAVIPVTQPMVQPVVQQSMIPQQTMVNPNPVQMAPQNQFVPQAPLTPEMMMNSNLNTMAPQNQYNPVNYQPPAMNYGVNRPMTRSDFSNQYGGYR